MLESNQTNYIGETVEMHCSCNEEGGNKQTVWYFANGTRVPVGKTFEQDHPYHKRHKHA